MLRHYQQYQRPCSIVKMLFHLSVATSGLSWGVLFADSCRHSGLYSIQSLYFLGMILNCLSGVTTSFSSSLSNAAAFSLSAIAVPVYVLFHQPHPISLLSYLLIINCLYQFYHLTIIKKNLLRTLQNEINEKFQKDALQEFIDAIPGVLGTVDMNKTYTMVNNFMDGKIKNAILGTKVGQTVATSPVSQMILEFLQSTDNHWTREVYSRDLAGENWFLVTLKRIHTPHEGVMVAALPINELVQTKNDLKIQEARSQYAAKLASLGEFSANVAHEINNPLTIIEVASRQLKETLKDSPVDIEKISGITDKISETTQRISKIVRSLKSLSKNADEEPFTNTTFLNIIEPAKEIASQKLTEHNIALKISILTEDIALFGNEVQLGQVILNLISNSIDAIKELDERWIEIKYRPSFAWTDIFITDSGLGIPAEIQDKIMTPFFTTKGTPEGTGLGLSISKSIIENHSGQLTLLSDRPHTTFRIRLPRMTPWKRPSNESASEEKSSKGIK